MFDFVHLTPAGWYVNAYGILRQQTRVSTPFGRYASKRQAWVTLERPHYMLLRRSLYV